MLTEKELLSIIKRLQPISIGLHKIDVGTITLIGDPRDTDALDEYLMKRSLENYVGRRKRANKNQGDPPTNR